MTKPTVHYDVNYPAIIEVGYRAYIKPVDHPNHLPGHNVSNTQLVYTSTVVSIDPHGIFETLNTRYVPTSEPVDKPQND